MSSQAERETYGIKKIILNLRKIFLSILKSKKISETAYNFLFQNRKKSSSNGKNTFSSPELPCLISQFHTSVSKNAKKL